MARADIGTDSATDIGTDSATDIGTDIATDSATDSATDIATGGPRGPGRLIVGSDQPFPRPA